MPTGDSGSQGAPAPRDSAGDEQSIRDRIRRLLTEQAYAVLCTQGQSQPYASLVAFAASDDLKRVVFSTPVARRKYRLLTECENVALLVDSRCASPKEIMQIEAVTITGRARVVAPGLEFDILAGLVTARHPHLAAFVYERSSALVCVEVNEYVHVCRFQDVEHWTPGSAR